MLEKENQLLQQEYQNAVDEAGDSPFHRLWLDEKIRHSHQVLGAGRYILKHAPAFQNRSPEFINTTLQAILLHDVGRFKEFLEKFRNPGKYDHGVLGSELLRTMPEYNRPEIILSIKHHGHLNEQFYADLEYQAIKDTKLGKDVETILFAVMDADKIANYYQMKRNPLHFQKLAYSLLQPENIDLPLSEYAFDSFCQHNLFMNERVKSMSDFVLSIACWAFDLNYAISLDFCRQYELVTNLLQIVAKYNKDRVKQSKIEQIARDYFNPTTSTFKEHL